jgi:hypothetical protein
MQVVMNLVPKAVQLQLTKKIMSRRFIQGVVVFGVSVIALQLSTQKAQAQSMTLNPSSGTIAVSATQSIDIIAESPTSGMNTTEIRITVPSIVSIQSFTDGPGVIISFGCLSGSAKYSATQICATLARSSDYADGTVIASFTIQGVSNGTAAINFVTDNGYSTSSTFTEYTGLGGTYTIGAGGATTGGSSSVDTGGILPATALVSDEVDRALLALFIIACGFSFFYFERKSRIAMGLLAPSDNDVGKNYEREIIRKINQNN